MARENRSSALFVLAFAFVCAGGAAVFASQAAPKPQTPVFGADVALVAVPVFVTDKNGRAVGGLTQEDFTVEDGGTQVPIVAFQAIDVDAPTTAASQARMAQLPVAVQAAGPRQFLLLIDLQFGLASRLLALDDVPLVVKDADGFDRHLLNIMAPETPPGGYTLRLTFRDPGSGQTSRTETTVWIES